jgi:cyclophilin family peptidyl-prolyl cis-trans isomerase
VQGGDPTGTGKGGESAFPGGEAFKDEFLQQLQHKGKAAPARRTPVAVALHG